MIAVKHLTKVYSIHQKKNNLLADIFFRQYQKITALDNISFTIGKNELVGLIGPNGAGKTTTLKILAGILYPTAGKVKVLGYTPFTKQPDYLKQISFIAGQRNQLIWDLPASDTFTLNQKIYEVDEQSYKKTVRDLAQLLECEDKIYKPVKTLSLGERMKMELIAALIHRPKLIFMDEPTIGLDLFSQQKIRRFLKTYQEKYQATIILTSHYMEDVKALAKRVIIINRGRIICDDQLKNIINTYSSEKIIRVTLDTSWAGKPLPFKEKPLQYVFPKIIFKVDKKHLAQKIKLISESLPFCDLTVEDKPIEEIIKEIFSGKLKLKN
jgi:ABC-2 type transport system ATP-binding protein